MQQWREPRNPINVLKIEGPAKYDFLIAAPYVDKITHRVAELIRQNKKFAVLIPVSLLTEIDRKANGEIDEDVKKARQRLTTIVILPVSKLWLINHPDLQGK